MAGRLGKGRPKFWHASRGRGRDRGWCRRRWHRRSRAPRTWPGRRRVRV